MQPGAVAIARYVQALQTLRAHRILAEAMRMDVIVTAAEVSKYVNKEPTLNKTV